MNITEKLRGVKAIKTGEDERMYNFARFAWGGINVGERNKREHNLAQRTRYFTEKVSYCFTEDELQDLYAVWVLTVEEE